MSSKFARAVATAVAAATSDPPPAPPQRPVVEEHFGTPVADPYRALEDLDDPAVRDWLATQSQMARAAFDALPGRQTLLTRLEEIERETPGAVAAASLLRDGEIVCLKRDAGQDVATLRYRPAGSHPEEVLVDPGSFPRADPADHLALECFAASPDGRHVIFGLAAAGSEETTLRILDRRTGSLLPESIPRVEAVYAWPCWLDDHTFTYAQRRPREAGAAEAETQAFTQARLHRLGSQPEDDLVVLGSDAAGSPRFEPLDFPSVFLTPGSRWAVGQVRHGDETDLSLFVAPAADLGTPGITWTPVCGRADMVTAFGIRGDEILLLTSCGAPRGRVVRTSLARPDVASAATVYEPESAVADAVAVAADAVYVGITDRAALGVVRVPHDEPDHAVRLTIGDDEPSATVVAARPDVAGVLLRTASWVRHGRILRYDPRNPGFTDTGLLSGGGRGPAELVAREVMVPSHDGVEVPLSIVHRRGLRVDGTAPAILVGYGAYGATTPMSFSAERLAWLERGGVIAVAHVRGGGAFGKAWHHAGRKTTKPNTWKDFIACAEFLVAEGLTLPARLCGSGRSAGGILIGRAITDRPDLFVAAHVGVGCTDMIRFETTANGPPNIPEFGSLAKEDEFRGLLAMSTLHQIRDGVPYPGVVLTHGINDPRVAPWQSAKTAARLQAATASPRPVLLRIDYHAGHGQGSTRRQAREELADVWSFFLWQCGDPHFQPAAGGAASPSPDAAGKERNPP